MAGVKARRKARVLTYETTNKARLALPKTSINPKDLLGMVIIRAVEFEFEFEFELEFGIWCKIGALGGNTLLQTTILGIP